MPLLIMAYEKTIWESRDGTYLNRFRKEQETSTYVNLQNAPNTVTRPGTKFSVSNMNKIEQGIFDAHEMIENEAQERQTQVNELKEQIQTTNHVLEGVHTTALVGATLTRVIGGTTEIPRNLFEINTVFIQGKTVIFDEHGTTGVYIDDIDPATILIKTKSISPVAELEPTLLGDVLLFNELPSTIEEAELLWGRTPRVDDYAQVITDENFDGRRVEYYITKIDEQGNITWGNPVPLNTADFQAQTTAMDSGKILVGGQTPGTFGKSIPVDIEPTESSNNLANSGGIFAWVKNLFDSKQNKLNRTVGGNDDATGTVTDTGGNLNVPISVTTVAPAASNTQTTAGTRSLRAQLKILIDNVAYLFTNSATLNTLYPVGSRYDQHPNDLSPSERGLPGTWEKWNKRAEMYELITEAQYTAVFSAVPAYWTTAETIAASVWKVWTPGDISSSGAMGNGSSSSGTRRILRSNKAVTSQNPLEMNPIDWDDLSKTHSYTIRRAARRHVANHSWTAADLTIGSQVASVQVTNDDGTLTTYTNMRVVGILTKSGTALSYAGGNRPPSVSGGIQSDAIRKFLGTLSARDGDGVFSSTQEGGTAFSAGSTWIRNTKFDPSRVVPVAVENQVRNVPVISLRRTS